MSKQEMTPNDFENLMAEIFSAMGFWALVIPKNRSGAQPFDIIAIGKNAGIWAADCKMCEQPRFPIRRIEDNQWLAMEKFRNLRDDATTCFFCYYDGDIYIIPYTEAVFALKHGQASIRLSRERFKTTNRAQAFVYMTHEEIEKKLNRKV